jgi:hypothetical protein
MDREYELDMLAYRFSPFEDVRWLQADGGLRTWTGSIRRDILAIKTQIKNTVSLGDDRKNFLRIEGILQEDAQSERSFLELSYAYRWTPHHAMGVRHTFSKNKADLDLTVFYRHASRSWGRAEAGFTFLNVYNDFIYNRLGIEADTRDKIRIYDQSPYLLEISYASPDRFPVGGEIIVGWQPESRFNYISQANPSYSFQTDERVYYLSILLEYRHNPVSVGLYLKRDGSHLHRVTTGDSLSTDYRSR